MRLSLARKTDLPCQYEAAEEVHAGWIIPFEETMERIVSPVSLYLVGCSHPDFL